MKLHYTFEVETDIRKPAYNNDMEERWSRGACEVEFTYEVKIYADYVAEFIAPSDYKTWSQDKKQTYIEAIDDAIKCGIIDLEDLEENDDFITFMEDMHREDAKEECERYYE